MTATTLCPFDRTPCRQGCNSTCKILTDFEGKAAYERARKSKSQMVAEIAAKHDIPVINYPLIKAPRA